MWARFVQLLDGDDAGTERSKIDAFQAILLLIIGTEYWTRAIALWAQFSTRYFVALGVATVLTGAGLLPRLRRTAFALLCANHVALISFDFPSVGNHAYLEAILCLLSAVLAPGDPGDRRLFLRSVRWIVCLVLFYSGLQKLVYGYYFHGQLLAYKLQLPNFRTVLSYLLPADELARLLQFKGRPGDGPYLVSSPLFVFVSNFTYVAELGLVPLLLARRTRHLAIVAALLLFGAIEAAAREFYFGLVFVNCLFLFLRNDLHRRLVLPAAVVLIALLLSRAGVLPEMTFY